MGDYIFLSSTHIHAGAMELRRDAERCLILAAMVKTEYVEADEYRRYPIPNEVMELLEEYEHMYGEENILLKIYFEEPVIPSPGALADIRFDIYVEQGRNATYTEALDAARRIMGA